MAQKLTKRADGRYCIRYHGKSFYGKTQKEAISKRDAYIDEEKRGMNHDLSTVTFREMAERWITAYRSECCMERNKLINIVLCRVSDWMEEHGKAQIKNITTTDIQLYFNSISGEYSKVYASMIRSCVFGVFKSAVNEGAIIRNPADDPGLKIVGKENAGHRCLEVWEQQLVTEHYEGHHFGLCAMLMLYAGLRRAEAAAIDIDRDVDFEHNTITVRGSISWVNGEPEMGDGKTSNAKRTIPLLPQLRKALEGKHGKAFPYDGIPTRGAVEAANKAFCAYLTRIVNGLPERAKITRKHTVNGIQIQPKIVNIRCHDYRVTFCTNAYEAGVQIKTLQKWMGHANAEMIMKVYAKLTAEQEAEAEAALAETMAAKMKQRVIKAI